MIYTAICGTIDPPRNDITVFQMPSVDLGSPRLNAKIFKVLSHLYVKEPSVWVDGNVFPKATESEILSELLGDDDIAVFHHPQRATIRQEADHVAQYLGIRSDALIRDFGDRLNQPDLCECTIVLRAFNDRVEWFNEVWWSLICRYCIRDQLTFPLAVSRVPGLQVRVIRENLREHRMFQYVFHPRV